MARKVNQALWDQWRRRIERQRGGGLSIAAFSRREGVSQASFHAWRRKLGNWTSAPRRLREGAAQRSSKTTRQRTVGRRQRAKSSRRGPAGPTGAPRFLQLPVLGARSSPWIELTLADGVIVRVPQQNLAALDAVLRALRGGYLEALAGEASDA